MPLWKSTEKIGRRSKEEVEGDEEEVEGDEEEVEGDEEEVKEEDESALKGNPTNWSNIKCFM